MLRFLFLLFILTFLSTADEHNQADLYFQNEAYDKAYSLYLEYAKKAENPDAAFKLGWMHENGKGVAQDPEKAIYWYKKAAKWDSRESNRERVMETLYRNFDPVSDSESADTLVQLASGAFALRAYEPNYWIVSYTNVLPSGDPVLEETEYIHTETKFQISLRADYVTEWLGFTQMWTGAYTQISYWQIFLESSPFRETDHMPEVLVTFPFYHALDAIHMKAVAVGYKHASNGQPGEDDNATRVRADGPFEGSRSRSWNRLYIRGHFQWNRFLAELTLWHRLKDRLEKDDNPDIVDYYGHGSLELSYIHKKLLTRLKLRKNFSSGYSAAELELSYPVPISDNIFFFLQGFSGYGQSLIDYDHYTNQVGFGLSISR